MTRTGTASRDTGAGRLTRRCADRELLIECTVRVCVHAAGSVVCSVIGISRHQAGARCLVASEVEVVRRSRDDGVPEWHTRIYRRAAPNLIQDPVRKSSRHSASGKPSTGGAGSFGGSRVGAINHKIGRLLHGYASCLAGVLTAERVSYCNRCIAHRSARRTRRNCNL